MFIDESVKRRELASRLKKIQNQNKKNETLSVSLPGTRHAIYWYPASLSKNPKGGFFVAGRCDGKKVLFLFGRPSLPVMKDYDGKTISKHSDFIIKCCPWDAHIAKKMRLLWKSSFLADGDSGISYSFPDLFGYSGKAQASLISGKNKLAFFRQSVPQMAGLELDFQNSINRFTWLQFQEGKGERFFAEAADLETVEELQKLLSLGYSRFSVIPHDPSFFALRKESKKNLVDKVPAVPWIALGDKFEIMFHRYHGRNIELLPVAGPGAEISSSTLFFLPREEEILKAICIFGNLIVRIVEMERLLYHEGIRDQVIMDIDFSSIKPALTPFEHFFVLSELQRRDVFPDFIGPGNFSLEHQMIAGNAGIRGLSGPVSTSEIDDKKEGIPIKKHFVFPEVSYLAAIKCMALSNPPLFRSIWRKSRNCFENAKKGKEVDVKIQHIPDVKDMDDSKLPFLFENETTNVFLSVTMEFVLKAHDAEGNRYLKNKFMDFLRYHEEVYSEALLEQYKKVLSESELLRA